LLQPWRENAELARKNNVCTLKGMLFDMASSSALCYSLCRGKESRRQERRQEWFSYRKSKQAIIRGDVDSYQVSDPRIGCLNYFFYVILSLHDSAEWWWKDETHTHTHIPTYIHTYICNRQRPKEATNIIKSRRFQRLTPFTYKNIIIIIIISTNTTTSTSPTTPYHT
jgi:hypothetical protein